MNSLHVYAVFCSWHGSIYEAKLFGPGVPGCPHCGSPLFQIDEDKWTSGAAAHEAKGHANYVEFLAWGNNQQRCWPSLAEAANAFQEETGKAVLLKL